MKTFQQFVEKDAQKPVLREAVDLKELFGLSNWWKKKPKGNDMDSSGDAWQDYRTANLPLQKKGEEGDDPQAYMTKNLPLQKSNADVSNVNLQWQSASRQAGSEIAKGIRFFKEKGGNFFKKYPQIGQKFQTLVAAWQDFGSNAEALSKQLKSQNQVKQGTNMGDMSGYLPQDQQYRNIPLQRTQGKAPVNLQRTRGKAPVDF